MWLWLALLGTPLAMAQDPPGELTTEEEERARGLFENGRRLYEEGSYEAAIVAWDACYAITARPELLYNLSTAHERLGHFEQALDLLNRYRAEASLSAEEHDRLARKASTLEVRLTAAVAQAQTRQRSGRRGTGTAMTVLGSAALVTGALLGGSALSARADIRDNCRSLPEGFLCPDTLLPQVSRAERDGTLSLVALGLGGVATVSGIGLLVSGSPAGDAQIEVSWAF